MHFLDVLNLTETAIQTCLFIAFTALNKVYIDSAEITNMQVISEQGFS